MARSSAPNQGIQIFGGSFKANQVATGKEAHATQVVHRSALPKELPDEIRAQWDTLTRALVEHADKLKRRDQDQIEGARAEVGIELAKPRPDKSKVLGFLESVGSAVSSTAGIATAVEALKQAVMSFL